MRRKLIIDGNAVYEIDDDCARRKEERQGQTLEQQTSTGKKLSDAGNLKEGQNKSCCHESGSQKGQSKNIRFL